MRNTQESDRWGFVWQGKQYEGLVTFFLEVLWGHGGEWIDPQTRTVHLDEPEASVALTFMVDLIGNESPPGVTTYTEEETRNLFQSGRAVFLRNWLYVWRLAIRAAASGGTRLHSRRWCMRLNRQSAAASGAGVSRYRALPGTPKRRGVWSSSSRGLNRWPRSGSAGPHPRAQKPGPSEFLPNPSECASSSRDSGIRAGLRHSPAMAKRCIHRP